MSLKAGPDGKAAVDLDAKSLPPVLPYAPAVTIQLKAWSYGLSGDPTVDACWGATFSTPSLSSDTKFKASSD